MPSWPQSWSMILWKEPSGESRELWAERVVRTLEAAERIAAVSDWEIPGEKGGVPFEPEREAVAALIEQNVSVNDIGERMEDSPKGLTFLGAPQEDERSRLWAHLAVDSHTPLLLNTCVVDLRAADLVPGPARALFEEALESWSPFWGALAWRANTRVRTRELEEAGIPSHETMPRILHWCTFLSSDLLPPERTERLQGLEGIEAQPREGGTELLLDEAWRSPEALLAAQRRFEPLLSD